MVQVARVALVHGLWYGRPAMWPLKRKLSARGWRCESFGYASVHGRVDSSIRRLADWAVGLHADRLDFVGHSLGGLLTLAMLAEHGRRLPPGRVVLLGSPLQGSAVARRMAANRLLRPLIGQAAELLDRGIPTWPAGREIGAIAGTASLGGGQLLGRLQKPHDGTVSVAETRHPELHDHIELPASHTGLVLSSEVAAAVDRFLSVGRFAKSS